MKRTIADIKRANKEAGYFFFKKDTLRYWNSVIDRHVYGNRFFVTSENMDGEEPRFTVRRFDPETSRIWVHGKHGGHRTLELARDAAREAAREK